MSTIVRSRTRSGLVRWAALGGVAYVVLFVVGIILIFDNEPDTSSAPAKIIAFYSDSGHWTPRQDERRVGRRRSRTARLPVVRGRAAPDGARARGRRRDPQRTDDDRRGDLRGAVAGGARRQRRHQDDERRHVQAPGVP